MKTNIKKFKDAWNESETIGQGREAVMNNLSAEDMIDLLSALEVVEKYVELSTKDSFLEMHLRTCIQDKALAYDKKEVSQ